MSKQYKLTDREQNDCGRLAGILYSAFHWSQTPDGHDFWENIYCKLGEMAEHGTSDGNPWVEPVRVPTDEDAKSRPKVLVRDIDHQAWRVATLLAVLPGNTSYRFVVIRSDDNTCEHFVQCKFAN